MHLTYKEMVRETKETNGIVIKQLNVEEVNKTSIHKTNIKMITGTDTDYQVMYNLVTVERNNNGTNVNSQVLQKLFEWYSHPIPSSGL